MCRPVATPGRKIRSQVMHEVEIIKKATVGDPSTPLGRGKHASKDVDDMLNKGINFHQNVAALYESASAFFSRDNVGLPGIAFFFKVYSVVERNDIWLTVDFMAKRGAHAHFGSTSEPPPDWTVGKEGADVTMAFTKALALQKVAMEKTVMLHNEAVKCGDAPAADFANCCIRATSEKIRALSHYVAHLKQVEHDKHGIKDFDRRITFELEEVACAAGLEAGIQARLNVGSMLRAHMCQTHVFDKTKGFEEEWRAKNMLNKVV
eukprot:TRINITY_DN2201_c0_g1_i2.p1 TRINITY_DN2201_c0_g1~~TRINITY_DN2201_c0_g1_i2.p1  ORF type:complete len:263 (+),score=64.54 TRINITY_DN2201_c0_g1_i2:154-942(+)